MQAAQHSLRLCGLRQQPRQRGRRSRWRARVARPGAAASCQPFILDAAVRDRVPKQGAAGLPQSYTEIICTLPEAWLCHARAARTPCRTPSAGRSACAAAQRPPPRCGLRRRRPARPHGHRPAPAAQLGVRGRACCICMRSLACQATHSVHTSSAFGATMHVFLLKKGKISMPRHHLLAGCLTSAVFSSCGRQK